MSRETHATVAFSLEPIAVNREQAAQALGVSLDHFDRHIRNQLRSIKCGQRVLYAVDELRRWAERASDSPLRGAA